MDPLTLGFMAYNLGNAIYGNQEDQRKTKSQNQINATQTRYSRSQERPGFVHAGDRVMPAIANTRSTASLYGQAKAAGIGQDWGSLFGGDSEGQNLPATQGPNPLGATSNNPWDLDMGPQKAGPMPAGIIPGAGVALQGMQPQPEMSGWDRYWQQVAQENAAKASAPQFFMGH